MFQLRKYLVTENCEGKRSCPVLYQVQLKIFSNLHHGFIVSHTSICGCFKVDIFRDFFIVGVVSLFYLEKMWPVENVKVSD